MMDEYSFTNSLNQKLCQWLSLTAIIVVLLGCFFSILPSPGFTILVTLMLATFFYIAPNVNNLRTLSITNETLSINGRPFQKTEVKGLTLDLLYGEYSKKPTGLLVQFALQKTDGAYFYRGAIDEHESKSLEELKSELENKLRDCHHENDPFSLVNKESLSENKFFVYGSASIVLIPILIWASLDYLKWGDLELEFPNQSIYGLILIFSLVGFALSKAILYRFYSPEIRPSTDLSKYVRARKDLCSALFSVFIFFCCIRAMYFFNRTHAEADAKNYELDYVGYSGPFRKSRCFVTLHFVIISEKQSFDVMSDCKYLDYYNGSKKFYTLFKKGPLGALMQVKPLTISKGPLILTKRSRILEI